MTSERDRDDLLSYLYDALAPEERAVMERRLAAEPDLREALDAARTQQELLGRASEIPAQDVRLRKPRARIFTRRGLGIAAGVLLALGVGFVGVRASHRSALAQDNPVLVAKGPGSHVPGTSAEFEMWLTDSDGDALEGRVAVEVLAPDGTSRGKGEVTTDDDGFASILLDPDGGDPGERARVRLVATTEDGEQITQTLPLRDGRKMAARVSTDKPLYRPGETVRIRGVALEAFRLTAPGDVPLKLTMTDPRGGTVFEHKLLSDTGTCAWEHELPRDLAGGAYKLTLAGWADDGLVTPTERTFEVRSYRVPRLRFDMELDRDTYGPGDAGTAQLSVERAEGGVPVGATAEAVLRVDGNEIARETLVVGTDGGIVVPFTLPFEIVEGRGQISVTVEDGGVVETTAKTVPIALGRLDVELYPEGGDLVAGLPSRVYFRVRTPAGEPADTTFELVDGDEVVAVGAVDVRGMGLFELTPRAGAAYSLRAVTPFGVDLAAEMPVVKEAGAVLRAADAETAAAASLRLQVAATESGTYGLEAWCRGGRLSRATIPLKAGRLQDVELPTASSVGGVIRVTLTGPDGTPLAERLVSRAPDRGLVLSARAEREKYAPRERVKVTVTARDLLGAPVMAMLGAGVADEAVLSLANDEDAAPLPLHFLLGLEVDELEKAEVYADGEDAEHAVDLLLGVQGWRRFAWRDVDEFVAEHGADALRLVAVSSDSQTLERNNADSARSVVESQMRRWDNDAREISIAGGILLLVVGGMLFSIRSLWNRRLGGALVGVIPAAILGALIVMVQSGAMPNSNMVEMAMPGMAVGAADGGAWGPPEAEMPAKIAGVRIGGAAPNGDPDLLLAKNELLDDVDADGDDDARKKGKMRLADMRRRRNRPQAKPDAELAEIQAEFADMEFEMDELIVLKDSKYILARAYVHTAAAPDGTRSDFTEVLYWNPLLVTDEKGEATFEFDTSDSITSFRIAVEGTDGAGGLGASFSLFENRVPFYVEPKFPMELSAGDELFLPVAIANDTDAALGFDVTAESTGGLLELRDTATFGAEAAAGARTRVLVPFIVRQGRGDAALTLRALSAAGHSDVTTRTIPIVPRGYPRTVARSGVVERVDGAEFLLPADLNPVTVAGALKLYPSTLSTLVDGLEGILREPNGCFEQASSSNYPNVLVMRYMQDQGVAAPAVARRARELMASGYAKIAGYECSDQGYEWFGGDPGHEALTAYGLMEFVDMEHVFDVDDEMVARTREWLLDRRDGDGGFSRNARALDSFGAAPDEITNAYITWALTEAGEKDEIVDELAKLLAEGKTSDDPYVVALAANAALNVRNVAAADLVQRLATMQASDGHFEGQTTSITSSRGSNLHIETTSLAALAFTKSNTHIADAEEAIAWLLEQRSGGSFGTTQATIMALRALVAHAQAARTTASAHDVVVKVNGAVVAERHIPEGASGAIVFEREVLDALRPGENSIEVTASGEETLPWALSLDYATQLPASDPSCPVRLTTALDTDTAVEGDTVGLHVELTNTTDEGQPMTLARIALPAGLEARTDQLDELKDAGAFDFWETRPREITLYYRALAPSAVKTIDLDLVASVPGKFEGPASSAYLYYTNDAKQWAAPLAVTIQARR